MEYSCLETWGFSSAGAAGLSSLLGKHFSANMPALKKQARELGFEIVTVGYVGVSGGPGRGDSISRPRTKSMREFMLAAHDAYVASGYDRDYIPDAVSIHAYPYSPDFGFDTPLADVITYFDRWTRANRAVINSVWGPTIGSQIKLVMSEWNAGNSVWPGYMDHRVDDFYNEWLRMLRRNDFWMANVFAIASNGRSNHDLIGEDGIPRRHYDAFKSVSTSDPLAATEAGPLPSPPSAAGAMLTIVGIPETRRVAGALSIVAVPELEVAGVGAVDFFLNGRLMRTERQAPYCFTGDDSALCSPFDTSTLPRGRHVITAVMYYGSAQAATASEWFIKD
jgi:hypothetical protein